MLEGLLYQVFILIVGPVSTASFSYFLDFCFRSGNILDFYLPWLAKKLLRKNVEVSEEVSNAPSKEEAENILINSAYEKTKWFKPLGGCVVCMNFWIALLSVVLAVVVFNLNFIFSFFYVFLCVLALFFINRYAE